MGVHPGYHLANASAKEHLFTYGIIVSTLLAFAITAYCLSAGIFVVCSHLFYVPIILASYRYPDRAIAFAGLLAAGYLAEVITFSPGSGFEVVNALLRTALFLIVAAVVSQLSARLQARESRYRGIFETSGAGLFLFSPVTGKIEEMNRECAEMLGYPGDAALPLDAAAVWPGAPGVNRVENLDCTLTGWDGKACPVLLSANPLPDQDLVCVAVTGTAEQKRSENRLRRSEETYRVILNTADVGVLLTDPGRRIVEMNTAAVRLFGGAGPEDLVGRNPEDLIAEGSREAVRVYRERVLSGETPAPAECVFCRLDGSEWPGEVSATRLPRDGDAPERLVLSIRDVTERHRAAKRMREENRRLSIVNEVVAAATAPRRLDSLFGDSLAKIVDLLEFDEGAVYLMPSGSDTAALHAREGTDPVLPQTVRLDDLFCETSVPAGEVYCIEDLQERYPGSGIRALVMVPIPGDGRLVGWIALGSRARKTVPEAERDILLDIGKELGNVVVKGMLHEELQTALSEVNLYVDILTHDINNANTAAMGYLQMYLEYAAGSDGAMVEKSLAAVHQSNEIIRNVSTLRRLKARPAELVPVALGPVIREVRSYHTGSRITYDGVDATVLADDLIGEVFTNLIGNAAKFGGADVEVTISAREEGDAVLVTVADTGPGIPDALKPHIFERYQRGETRKSGKGLGLYIVWMLVERYGGSILVGDRVSGRPGEGAAFMLTLPRYHPAVAAGEPND